MNDDAERIHRTLLALSRSTASAEDEVRARLDDSPDAPRAASGLVHGAWAGIEAYAKALRDPMPPVADTVEANPIKGCWMAPLGDVSEVAAAGSLADRAGGNPAVAAGLGTLALHVGKLCYLLATAQLQPGEAAAHLERVIAAILIRLIEEGGLALGVLVGTMISQPELGALLGCQIAQAIGPELARVGAKGATELVVVVAAIAAKAPVEAQAWLTALIASRRLAVSG